MDYTSVFGNDAVPPSDNSYASVTLTADTQFYWPELSVSSNLLFDILDVHQAAAYAITLDSALSVSDGKSVTFNNLSAFDLTVKDCTGATVSVVATGKTKLVVLSDNSTAAGVWTTIDIGSGTTVADAAALAGAGLKVVSSKLAQFYSSRTTTATTTITDTDRAKTIIFSNSGAVACNLPLSSAAEDGFFFNLTNLGGGEVTLTPAGSELIDNYNTKALAPGESATVICNGTAWVTVGFGRSTQFQFTKLVLDISTGSPFTLTSLQAQNKLIQFIGTATANVTVIVPSVVAIYYTECSYVGPYSLTIKTAAGLGITVNNSDRSILYCDGTNVVMAQTAAAPASDLMGGTAGAVVWQEAVDSTAFTGVGTAGDLLTSGGTTVPLWKNLGTLIAGLTEKLIPVATDKVPISDSEASGVGKYLSWSTFTSIFRKNADDVVLAAGKVVVFEGTTDDAYETTLTVTDPTADRTVTIQNADHVLAGTNIPQTFTAVQKSTVTTDNDLTIDLSAAMDVVCTPTAGGTLTFSNIAAGQKFEILFVNGSNYAITKGSNIKCSSTLFSTISVTGRYILAGRCLDGTNIDLTCSGALS